MKKVFIFALGIATGSLVTWKLVKEKYKRIADEEIESVVDRFNKRLMELEGKTNTVNEDEETEEDEIEVEDYNNMVDDLGYSEKDEEEYNFHKEYIAPYIISPDEFDEFGNKLKYWTCYSDMIITDENEDIISDYENYIGDALEHIGEFVDNCIHVRNENIETDFEIVKVDKTFDEAYGNNEDKEDD